MIPSLRTLFIAKFDKVIFTLVKSEISNVYFFHSYFLHEFFVGFNSLFPVEIVEFFTEIRVFSNKRI